MSQDLDNSSKDLSDDVNDYFDGDFSDFQNYYEYIRPPGEGKTRAACEIFAEMMKQQPIIIKVPKNIHKNVDLLLEREKQKLIEERESRTQE